MPDSQNDRERFSQRDLERRLSNVEDAQQRQYESMTKLTSTVDKMAHGIDTMRETLARMLDKEEKMQNLVIKIANLEQRMHLVMFVGAGIVLSLIGLGVTTLFGSP